MESRTSIEVMFRMIAHTKAGLAIGLALAWSLSLNAQSVSHTADLNDPVVKQWLKDSQEAVAKFESENPAQVKTIKERLKKVHEGIYQYLLKHRGVWPQPPSGQDPASPMKWWAETLHDYGVTETDLKGDFPMNLTTFDDRSLTAYRWSGQPWALVMCHPIAYIVTADGTVRGNGFSAVQPPKSLGPISIDSGGQKPAEIPEEMKKAAGTKPAQ